jgi:hypothetical protein
MNLKTLQAELAKIQKRGQRLESQIKSRAAKQFKALPGKVGLKTVDMLIQALMPYSSGAQGGAPVRRGPGRPPKSASAQAAPAKAPAAKKKAVKSSTRNRYSAAVKSAIRRELEKGGKTFNELSKEYGPSAFSIKDWKKSWGLTKPRKKK